MTRTEAVMQAIADEFALADTTDFLSIVGRSIDRIEAPPDPSCHARLRLMLVDLCGTIVRAIHARDASCSCHAASWEHHFDRHSARRPRSPNGFSELGGAICDSCRCQASGDGRTGSSGADPC